MKIGVKTVPMEMKDFESAFADSRRTSLCELIVNILLFIVALLYLGIGAYACARIIHGKDGQVATVIYSHVQEKVVVYYPAPSGGIVFSVSPTPSSSTEAEVINPSNLLDWPEVFRRDGWMEVSTESALNCWFHTGLNYSQSCLRTCYHSIESKSSVGFYSRQDDPNTCPAPHVDYFGVGKGQTDELNAMSEKADPSKMLPSLGPLIMRNFTANPHQKAVAIKMSKPVITIKMPVLNMSYSDHTKLCLSFCALHPDCFLCSAFPDETMMVVPDQDKVAGPAGHNGTLFCMLFRGANNLSAGVHGTPAFGAVTYVVSSPSIEAEESWRAYSPDLFEKKLAIG